MNRGYLFLCFGKYYVDEASNLVKMLRNVGDEYPVSILCTKEDFEYATSLELFNEVIIFNFDNEFSKLDNTSFERFGGTPKILMVDYLPYDETVYLDTDMLVQSNPKNVWDFMESFNQPCVLTGGSPDPNDRLYHILANKIVKNVSEMKEVHSGIVYYKKIHKDFSLFSETLKYFWKNYDEYGLSTRRFRSGKADEHAFAAVINKLDYKVADPKKTPIITHNYHHSIELPSNIVTGGVMYNVLVELDSAIPFVHMFKEYRKHYDILYARLMNNSTSDNSMKICIIGSITKYGPDDIKNYVNSIIKSGFKGRKVMMVYDVPQSTISFLKDNGWEVYEGELSQHIILQRFFDVSNLCDMLTDDVLIWTDVKDVIFQLDPTEWLRKHMQSPILATSETILFKDEEWAVINAGTSFPVEWSWLQNKVSYCAGVIIAKREYMRDLFNEIYRWSLTTSNPEQLSDQAAFNVLINLKHFQNDVQFVEQNSGLVTHMGVSWVKRHTHRNKLTELPPAVTHDGLVCTPDDTLFCIVHQYDRDHHLKSLVNNKYA